MLPHPKRTHEEKKDLSSPPKKVKATEKEMFHVQLTGVVLLARMNKKRRFFLAGRENKFGEINVEAVMIDSGCNSLLLPLRKGEISQLSVDFPPKSFHWQIASSTGVSSQCLCLKITAKVGEIPVTLCKDLLKADQTGISTAFQVRFLRFHLCSEDLRDILETEHVLQILFPQYEETIREFISLGHVIPRRTHALLGQELLSQYSSFQHGKVIAVVDPRHFLLCSWEQITDLEGYIFAHEATLPENFNDLEDEDHEGDDEEFYELEE